MCYSLWPPDLVYRKGKRPIEKQVVDYLPEHSVASGIADGDQWLDAWLGQMGTPWETITRKTGISRARIEELSDDVEPTSDEIAELATLWWVTPEGLQRWIAQANSVG